MYLCCMDVNLAENPNERKRKSCRKQIDSLVHFKSRAAAAAALPPPPTPRKMGMNPNLKEPQASFHTTEKLRHRDSVLMELRRTNVIDKCKFINERGVDVKSLK